MIRLTYLQNLGIAMVILALAILSAMIHLKIREIKNKK